MGIIQDRYLPPEDDMSIYIVGLKGAKSLNMLFLNYSESNIFAHYSYYHDMR